MNRVLWGVLVSAYAAGVVLLVDRAVRIIALG